MLSELLQGVCVGGVGVSGWVGGVGGGGVGVGGVCMCVCTRMHMCVCVCARMHTHVCVHVHMSVHACACVCVCTCVHVYVHMSVHACACVCVCTCVHVYVYMSVHTACSTPLKPNPPLPVRICVTVGILPLGSDGFALCEETLTVAYEAMLAAMQDYTTDSRGDVGAL